MCINLPGQIVEIVDPAPPLAKVTFGEQLRVVNLSLLDPQDAEVGAWVLVQAGLAVERISAEDAQIVLDIVQELEQIYRAAEEDWPTESI